MKLKDVQMLCVRTEWQEFTSSPAWTPPASGHFVEKEGNALKRPWTEYYNNITGFVVLSDMTAIIYSTYCTMWKWPKKLLHLA